MEDQDLVAPWDAASESPSVKIEDLETAGPLAWPPAPGRFWNDNEGHEAAGIDKFEMQTVTSKLKNFLLEDATNHLAQAGGAMQYLQLVDVKSFGEWLWATFPENDQFLYHHLASLPPVKEAETSQTTPLLIHVAALGFHRGCSLKPPPSQNLSVALIEQYLVEGFVTSTVDSGPLLVLERAVAPQGLPELWQDGTDNALQPFSLAYLKGMARSCTLLFLLHRLFVLQTDIAADLPKLHDSVCKIHCFHIKPGSRVEEALSNMRISCRGSLRKSTNLIQAVIMVQNLHTMGLADHMSFVRRWNQMATRQFQFVGKRNTALKLLFEDTPKASLENAYFFKFCYLSKYVTIF